MKATVLADNIINEVKEAGSQYQGNGNTAGVYLTLPGALDGVKFYLMPDFKKAAEVGLGNVIVASKEMVSFRAFVMGL